MIKTAFMSPGKLYRYSLRRQWDEDLPLLVIVGLNPSTADAEKDDPTIRRCISFAKRDGYGGVVMLNVFAFRATDPKVMADARDPVGPQNAHIVESVVDREDVLCAWGASAPSRLEPRIAMVLMRIKDRARRVLCLGKTNSGAPRHPLYVRGDTPMEDYSG